MTRSRKTMMIEMIFVPSLFIPYYCITFDIISQ